MSESLSRNINVIDSQQIFFDKLTRNKINELLNRVSTGYLQNQINNKLNNYYSEVRIPKNCMNIYIRFFDKNRSIGHISLHMNKSSSKINNNYTRKGRLHVVNDRNKNRYYTFRVTPKNDLFQMKINSPLQMKQDLEYCVNTTLDIFNEYTNANSKYSLNYRLTQEANKIHTCLNDIAGTAQRHRYKITPNRKKSIVYFSKSSSWNKPM